MSVKRVYNTPERGMWARKTEIGSKFLKLVHRYHSAKHLSFIPTKLQLILDLKKKRRKKMVLLDRSISEKGKVRNRTDSLSLHHDSAPHFHSKVCTPVTFTIYSLPLSLELHHPAPSDAEGLPYLILTLTYSSLNLEHRTKNNKHESM